MRARVSGVVEHAYFESLARDDGCDYCVGRRHVGTLAPDLTAIYCISLQEQPHRTIKAAAQFHALGLCREVLFYRPLRGRDGAGPERHRARCGQWALIEQMSWPHTVTVTVADLRLA